MSQFHLLRIRCMAEAAMAAPYGHTAPGSLRLFKTRYPTHTVNEVLTDIGTARSAAGAP